MANPSYFEALLVDFGFGPDERLGCFIVSLDAGIDVFAQLRDGRKRSAAQGLSLQDRKPDFHFVELGGPGRREVEMQGLVSRQPAVVLRLVGVEDDMDLVAGIGGGEQGGCAVALVVVAVADQGSPVGQLQIALGAPRSLNRGLLVDADHHRVLRRQPDLSRFGNHANVEPRISLSR